MKNLEIYYILRFHYLIFLKNYLKKKYLENSFNNIIS